MATHGDQSARSESSRVLDGSANVVDLAAPVVVPAVTRPDASEVEAHPSHALEKPRQNGRPGTWRSRAAPGCACCRRREGADGRVRPREPLPPVPEPAPRATGSPEAPRCVPSPTLLPPRRPANTEARQAGGGAGQRVACREFVARWTLKSAGARRALGPRSSSRRPRPGRAPTSSDRPRSALSVRCCHPRGPWSRW